MHIPFTYTQLKTRVEDHVCTFYKWDMHLVPPPQKKPLALLRELVPYTKIVPKRSHSYSTSQSYSTAYSNPVFHLLYIYIYIRSFSLVMELVYRIIWVCLFFSLHHSCVYVPPTVKLSFSNSIRFTANTHTQKE